MARSCIVEHDTQHRGGSITSPHRELVVPARSRVYRGKIVIAQLMRTRLGGRFVEFMRSDRGKRLDKWLVRTLGFSLLMHAFSARAGFAPIPVLLLFSTGRKSGQQRSAVMPYIELDRRLYLIGANGAKPNDPLWVDNLRNQPAARIILSGRERQVRSRILEWNSEEYSRVWKRAAELTPQYETYQGMTTRKVPIVVLE